MSSVNFRSRLGTPTNLEVGGTYDLLMLGFPEGFPQGRVTFEVGDTPRKITGLQKVAQTYLKILFTTQGSDVIYPTRGTTFPTLTVNANVTESDELFVSDLNEQIQSAVGQTKYILNTLDSDASSQLQSVTVLSLDLSSESLLLYLRIITGAGERASVAIPFPQLDMPLNESSVS